MAKPIKGTGLKTGFVATKYVKIKKTVRNRGKDRKNTGRPKRGGGTRGRALSPNGEGINSPKRKRKRKDTNGQKKKRRIQSRKGGKEKGEKDEPGVDMREKVEEERMKEEKRRLS